MEQRIGLFGTCDTSTWRQGAIARYEALGFEYYNPQVGVDEWVEEMAVDEARHLHTDSLILFPVTGESWGWISLSEVGFSVSSVFKEIIENGGGRQLIVWIEPDVYEELANTDPAWAAQNRKVRRSVHEHLVEQATGSDDVFFVSSMQEMIDLSVELFAAQKENAEVSVHQGELF